MIYLVVKCDGVRPLWLAMDVGSTTTTTDNARGRVDRRPVLEVLEDREDMAPSRGFSTITKANDERKIERQETSTRTKPRHDFEA